MINVDNRLCETYPNSSYKRFINQSMIVLDSFKLCETLEDWMVIEEIFKDEENR